MSTVSVSQPGFLMSRNNDCGFGRPPSRTDRLGPADQSKKLEPRTNRHETRITKENHSVAVGPLRRAGVAGTVKPVQKDPRPALRLAFSRGAAVASCHRLFERERVNAHGVAQAAGGRIARPSA